jgi:glycosyltransferase involved in cell wall biosynthesis
MFRIENRLVLRLLDAICGWLYRRADIVMVQSAAMPPLVERHGVAPEKIRVLPNTAAPFYRPELPEDHPKAASLVPKAPFVLMFAGNVGESQGLDLLVAAAELLRERDDIAYSIVGNGRAMDALVANIKDRGLGDRFSFAGRHPEAEMPGFFAQADAMFMSLKNYPNFALTVPYKTQAYMACAKPIVCSIRGEGARIVEEAGAGLACPPEDPGKLAAAIATMADMPSAEREAMGACGRRYFEANFAANVVYDLIEDTLAEVARSRKG